jgi:hypothetical protein
MRSHMNNTLRTGGAAASIISEEEAGDSNRKTVTSSQTTGSKLSEAPQGDAPAATRAAAQPADASFY